MMLQEIQNNNPGNIRNVSAYTWLGEIGTDYRGFVIFDTLTHGIRAMIKLLRNYGTLYGSDTIREIITRYAPAGAPDYNNPVLYISQVSEWSGINPDQVINWNDFNQVHRLISAMIRKETSETVPQEVILSAYQLAIPGGGVITTTPGAGSPTQAGSSLIGYLLIGGLALTLIGRK